MRKFFSFHQDPVVIYLDYVTTRRKKNQRCACKSGKRADATIHPTFHMTIISMEKNEREKKNASLYIVRTCSFGGKKGKLD